MKTFKTKVKLYDCDFYLKGSDIPYKTTLNMPWSAVLTAKKNAKLIGDKVKHSYSHTVEY